MVCTTKESTAKSIKTNWIIYIYIHYIIAIWCCDATDIVTMVAGIEQATVWSRIVVFILMGILIKFDCKYFELQKGKKSLIDIVAVCGLIILSLYMSIYPDVSYDVLCYHAINQEPGWGKNIGYFREIYSPLADRIFYPFRFLLGYRLGTFFNTIIYIITYFQCKKIFEVLLETKEKECPVFMQPSVLSILCLSLEAGLMDLGSYMSDMIGVPIVLEALYVLIEDDDREKEYFPEMVYFVILMVSLFLFKVSAAIYILPLLLVYLWKRRKNLTVLRFFLCLGIGVLSLIPNMIYNIKVTGTPLYELFCLLETAASGNGMGDVRWGGQTILEKIIWPVYMAFFPHYRHMELIDIPNIYPLAAFIALFFVGWKNIARKEYLLLTMFIVPFYLWVIMGGVDRYILAGVIFAGIFVCCAAYHLIGNGKKIRGYVLLCMCVLQCIGSFCGILVFNNQWKCAPSVLKQICVGDKTFMEEMRYWGCDRGELLPDGDKYEHFIVPERPYAGLASAVNCDAEILEVYFQNYGNEQTMDFINERMGILKAENTPVYSICMSKDAKELIQWLSQYRLQVVNIKTYEKTYLGSISILQIEISDMENEICMAGKEYTEVGTIEGGGVHNINSIVMIEPFVTWTKEPIEVSIYYVNGVDEVLLDSINVVPGNPILYEKQFETGGDGKIIVRTSGNYSLDADVVCLINLIIQ